MTNINRPVPSVELAKLNQPTMREISGMLLEVDALEHHLEGVAAVLAEPVPTGVSAELLATYNRGVAGVNAAVQAAKAKCAEARAALMKLKVDLQH